MSDYEMPPDPAEVNWNIKRAGRAWDAGEAMPRYYMTPEKMELIAGKLFGTHEERLRTLGLLLENCGAEAAVRMGDPAVWREAVARLDDPDATLEYAIDAALRRRDLDPRYDLAGIESFYETVTTPDYREQTENETVSRDGLLARARQENAERETHRPDYSVSIFVRESVRREADTATAIILQESHHHRYESLPESPRSFRSLPTWFEAERWRESWVQTPKGWLLQERERIEAPFIVNEKQQG